MDRNNAHTLAKYLEHMAKEENPEVKTKLDCQSWIDNVITQKHQYGIIVTITIPYEK